MEWQRIETAPRDGTPILAALAWGDGERVEHPLTIRWHEPWKQWVLSGCLVGIQNQENTDDHWNPTHWMPLPNPPTT